MIMKYVDIKEQILVFQNPELTSPFIFEELSKNLVMMLNISQKNAFFLMSLA